MAMIRSFMNTARVAGQRSFASGAKHTSVLAMKANTMKPSPLGQGGAVRHAGASVIGCGLATIAVGGCASGMGQLFAGLVVGTARNPSVKDDLFTYTLMGLGFVELLALVAIGLAATCLFTE